jgi:hypothetical protein
MLLGKGPEKAFVFQWLKASAGGYAPFDGKWLF